MADLRTSDEIIKDIHELEDKIYNFTNTQNPFGCGMRTLTLQGMNRDLQKLFDEMIMSDRVKKLQSQQSELRLKISKLEKELENDKCNLVDIEEEIAWHLAKDKNGDH